jgi:hypothetical protein
MQVDFHHTGWVESAGAVVGRQQFNPKVAGMGKAIRTNLMGKLSNTF